MATKPAVLRCDACTTYGPRPEIDIDVVYGLTVNRCADPVACRKRAEALGIWKRYL